MGVPFVFPVKWHFNAPSCMNVPHLIHSSSFPEKIPPRIETWYAFNLNAMIQICVQWKENTYRKYIFWDKIMRKWQTNDVCIVCVASPPPRQYLSNFLNAIHCMRLLAVIFAQFTLRKSCYRHLPLWKCVIFVQNYRNVFVRCIFLRFWLWIRIRIRIREQIKKITNIQT